LMRQMSSGSITGGTELSAMSRAQLS
jgi:hypothetical protein